MGLSIGHVSDEFFDGHTNHVTVAAWRAAVSDDSGNTFAELVHEEVILEGSVFRSPIKGREAVRNAIRQSSRLYERLEFRSLGADGRISRVVLSHRPLDVVVRFSAALGDRLAPR